ncbi:hypothetical protein ES703_93177 [subsurface metagenome]
MTLSGEDIGRIAKASADEISLRMGHQSEYAPYSKEGWEEHVRHFDELISNIKAGKVRIQAGYITNPNYGGYSYKEEIDSKIFGSVDFAAPSEVLKVLETAGIKEVLLAGDWWQMAGFKGWGEKIPVSVAQEKLPEWKAIFLGRLPSQTEEGG